MKTRRAGLAVVMGWSLIFMGASLALAGDTDDGISKATDESIAGDDYLGSANTNINFIVIDAMAKAKMIQYQAEKNANTDEDTKSSKKTKTNYNDGESENNENSIILEPGSQVDKVYNIIIEK